MTIKTTQMPFLGTHPSTMQASAWYNAFHPSGPLNLEAPSANAGGFSMGSSSVETPLGRVRVPGVFAPWLAVNDAPPTAEVRPTLDSADGDSPPEQSYRMEAVGMRASGEDAYLLFVKKENLYRHEEALRRDIARTRDEDKRNIRCYEYLNLLKDFPKADKRRKTGMKYILTWSDKVFYENVVKSLELNHFFEGFLEKGEPAVYALARRMRKCKNILTKDLYSRYAVQAFSNLITMFMDGVDEVYLSAAFFREKAMEQRDSDMPNFYLWEYANLSRKFDMADPRVHEEGVKLARFYLDDNVNDGLRVLLGTVLRYGFHPRIISSVWHSVFKESLLSEGWSFSPEAIGTLKGFAEHTHLMGHFESLRSVLTIFARRIPHKDAVLSALLEATDGAKWKSVRNTMSTIRDLNAMERLPKERVEAFYKRWKAIVVQKGNPNASEDSKNTITNLRAEIRRDIARELFENLREKMENDKIVDILVAADLPRDPKLHARWQRARMLREHLVSHGITDLLSGAATFLNEDGIRAMHSLMLALETGAVVDGRVEFSARYRMMAELGFKQKFVRAWSQYFEKVIDTATRKEDKKGPFESLYAQTESQIRMHANGAVGKKGALESLPERVRKFLKHIELRTSVSDGTWSIDRAQLDELWQTFNFNYHAIRETYGDHFANILTDLKVLRDGLRQGVRRGEKESVRITGDLAAMLTHGTTPAATCQRLTDLVSEDTNGAGQPINKTRWGHFKLAQYVIDGEVVARRMLEATRDAKGNEHILVETMYVAGAFAGEEELDDSIVEHAAALGIPRDRIHFLDRHKERESAYRSKAYPLMTGDRMYRDADMGEKKPRRIKKPSVNS